MESILVIQLVNQAHQMDNTLGKSWEALGFCPPPSPAKIVKFNCTLCQLMCFNLFSIASTLIWNCTSFYSVLSVLSAGQVQVATPMFAWLSSIILAMPHWWNIKEALNCTHPGLYPFGTGQSKKMGLSAYSFLATPTIRNYCLLSVLLRMPTCRKMLLLNLLSLF